MCSTPTKACAGGSIASIRLLALAFAIPIKFRVRVLRQTVQVQRRAFICPNTLEALFELEPCSIFLVISVFNLAMFRYVAGAEREVNEFATSNNSTFVASLSVCLTKPILDTVKTLLAIMDIAAWPSNSDAISDDRSY